MSAKLHRVTVSLTQEELSWLDHYRKRSRLPRGTALRLAALETIHIPKVSAAAADTPEVPAAGQPEPEAPAAHPGEADTPEAPAAGQPEPEETIAESDADQPKESTDMRIARMMRRAGLPESDPDQPKESVDERIARMQRKMGIT